MAKAAAGDLGALNLNVVGDSVTGMAVQPDGKMVITGQFTSVLGESRRHVARLNADGTLDMGFDPGANEVVNGVLVQADGRLIVFGGFTTLQPNGAVTPTTRNRIARLNSDGTVDASFDPNVDGVVNALAMQPDGKILVGGEFSSLQPNGGVASTVRRFLARLNGEGTVDPSFDPNPNGVVRCVATQLDGKILIGGDFTTLQPVGELSEPVRTHIARLNADGSLDLGFTLLADASVKCLVVQADGLVLLGGSFANLQASSVAPNVSRHHIARVGPDGAVDSSFDPNVNGEVFSLALQVDGKVLAGGGFVSLQPQGYTTPVTRNHLVRVNSDGTFDASFEPGTNGDVLSLCLQKDGAIMLGGIFTAFDSQPGPVSSVRNRFARVLNDSATQILSAPDFTQVVWTLGGAGPQVDSVFFELSTDGGISWTGLAPGERIQAGWKLSGLNLPNSGFLRVRGRTTAGMGNGSSGLIEQISAFDGLRIPEINLQGNGITIATGDITPDPDDHTIFGETSVIGGTIVRTYTVQNTGTGDLTLTGTPGVTIGGTNAAEFTVTVQPNSPVVPSGSTTFDIIFDPGAIGLRTAMVSISSNDPDESPYSFAIQGTGYTVPTVESPTSVNVATTTATLGGNVTSDGGLPVTERGVVYSNTATNANPLINGAGVVKVTASGTNGIFTTGVTGLTPGTGYSFKSYATNSAGTSYAILASFTTTFSDINLLGNGVTIVNSDSTPDSADHTDFGETKVTGGTIIRTFTVQNTGTGDLTLNGTPKVAISGTHAAEFTVTTQPSSPVVPSGTTNFQVTFDPAAIGLRTATVNISSNDPDESPYAFTVQGACYTVPTVETPASVNLTTTSATLVGNVTSDGGSPVIERGVVYSNVSTNPNPLINGNGVTKVTASGATGFFSVNLAGLNASTVYAYKAYATNSAGTTYTTAASFATLSAGSLDPFDATVVGTAGYATAMQPDGKVIIAGEFGLVKGVARGNIARLNADGTLDVGFDPKTNGIVRCVAVQNDGKILIGGTFTSLQPNGAATATTRNRVARLNADGTLDLGFDPNTDNYVRSLALQPDGKILLAGTFTQFQPSGAATASVRNGIARLNADGSLDQAFDLNVSGAVAVMALQPDGKIIVGGNFTSLRPNGATIATARRALARVNSDGSLDTGFDPKANNFTNCVVLQADGKVLIGGQFTTLQPNGLATPIARNYIARLNSDGSLDPDFDPKSNYLVYSIAVQTNGKILLGGPFTSLQPNGASVSTARNYIARLNTNGSLDLAFNPNANSYVNGIALQPEGHVLLGGPFTTLQPNGAATATTRSFFARLFNDAASQTLSVPNATQITWTRGGAGPEVPAVTFELSSDNGVSWDALGTGTRIVGGWRLNNLSLPASGSVRARARTYGGYYGGSSGLIEQVVAFGNLPAAPDINLQGNGITIADGSSTPSLANHTDFGSVLPASGSITRTFTIQNTGAANLSLSGTPRVAVSGTNAAEFSVTSFPESPLLSEAGATFQITFDPSAGGVRTALVSIASDDLDEGTYTFAIQGTGITLPVIASQTNTEIAASTVTLGANLVFDGGSPILEQGFIYSLTSVNSNPVLNSFGVTKVITGGSASIFTSSVKGLNSNSAYTFKAYATNSLGTGYTGAANFTTLTPGSLDPLNLNIIGSQVYTIAIQPDGKTLIGGIFTSVLGTPRKNLARINANGALDLSFNPNPNNSVDAMAIQPDGKIIISGNFTSLQPNNAVIATTRNYIARLNTDGTLDTSFNPNPNNPAYGLAVQLDGKILLCGSFTSLQPNGEITSTIRNYIARLNADGTLDTGFNPNPNNPLSGLAIQPDGKIIIGGNFTSLQPNGAATATSRKHIAQLNSDGTLIASFNPNPNDSVYGVFVQPDGKVLLGGGFTTLQPNGAPSATTRNYIARLNSDGALDTNFDPNTDGNVKSIALQANGKILLGGSFHSLRPNGTLSSTTRNYIALLNADGSLDVGFNPNPINGYVRAIAIQAGGSVLLGGEFSSLRPNGASTSTTRSSFAVVYNSSGTENLSVPDVTRINWTRSGSVPEISDAIFEISTDSGQSWSSFGQISRVAGGWKLEDLALPADGIIRARGLISNGSQGLIEQVVQFGNLPPLPDIKVVGNDLSIANNDLTPSLADHTDFGGVPVLDSSAIVRTFTLRNTANADLILTGSPQVTILGTHAADFTVTKQPDSLLLPAGSTTLQITFDPSAVGLRSATVRITSNDPDESPYNFALQGFGQSLPIVTAPSSAAISFTNATLGGNVTSENFSPILERGVVYSTSAANTNPTIGGNGVVKLTTSGTTGIYTMPVAMLVPSTNYSFRAYASNSFGTTYSSVDSFTTKTPVGGDYYPLDLALSSGSFVTEYVVQPDAKVIVAGVFDSLMGVARNNLARLNVDGSLDLDFDPRPNGQVTSAIVQADGKILVGGVFTSLHPRGAAGPVTRNRLARLNADGSLDSDFDPNPNGIIRDMVVQADGKVIVGGGFTTLQPNRSTTVVNRNYLARINADGTVDQGFNPNPNYPVYLLALQSDEKILVTGDFSYFWPEGASKLITRNQFARLNIDGSPDSSFVTYPSGSSQGATKALIVQPDGKILIAGSFESIAQPTSNENRFHTTRNRIARVNHDGTLDMEFDPNADGYVTSMALQADGKILITGVFGSFLPNGSATPITRHSAARLNRDGTIDTSFDPNLNDISYTGVVALQSKGEIILSGNFTSVSSQTEGVISNLKGLARFFNDSFSQSLTVPNTTLISWNRNGAGPELTSVAFDVSTDGGLAWTNVGTGSALAGGGWKLDDPLLPSTGLIRARGRLYDGAGLIEQVSAFSNPLSVPNASVLGNGTTISSGDLAPSLVDHTDFGNVLVQGGNKVTRVFTLKNTGTSVLNLTGNPKVSLSGPHADDFTVTAQPATSFLAAGASTVFEITLDPSSPMVRSASVAIASDDADETPYVFAIKGFGLAAPEVTTPTVSNISATTVRMEAVITAENGYPVTDWGFVFSPTLSNSNPLREGLAVTLVTKDDLNGTFAGTISGLTPSTSYALRSFTISAFGTAYSPNVTTFTTTGPAAPTVSNPFVGSVTHDSATLGGEVIRDNGSTVTTRGVVFAQASANSDPVINGVGVTKVQSDVTESFFTIPVPGLAFNTVYHFKAFATNGVGTAYSTVFTFKTKSAGDLDTFDASISGSSVRTTVFQPDGRMIVAGEFTSVMGVTRSNLARFNPDGTLDNSFDPKPNGRVNAVALQNDGKILICGAFTTLQPPGVSSPVPRNYLARLLEDGSIDTGFDPNPNYSMEAGSLLLQPDGKVIISGNFTSLQPAGSPTSIARNRIARLTSNGDVDASFDPRPDGAIYSLALQSDGKVIMGGAFSTLQPNGSATLINRRSLARVSASGFVDTGFDPNPWGSVYSLYVQADGKILVGGDFNSLRPNGSATDVIRNCLVRLNPSGTLDSSFTPDPSNSVSSLAVQADGKILAAGAFYSVNVNNTLGTARNRIARFYSDGSLDVGFDPNVWPFNAFSLQLRGDGRILLGGEFESLFPNGAVSGTVRYRLASLLNDSATQSLTVPDSTQISWSRSGSGPEVSAVTFELSTDKGVTWTPLGAGQRVTSGWRLTGISLPSNGTIRARGRTSGGFYNGSSSLIEQTTAFGNSPPTAVATHAVTNAAFGVVQLNGLSSSDSDGTISAYQWTWAGGSATGATPTVTLPSGETEITLTVTDDQGATGTATFTVAVESLGQVLAAAGLVGTNATPSATPFGDGLSNLVKYAFNLNLSGPDTRLMAPGGSAGLPSGGLRQQDGQTYWRVEYLRRKGSGLVYTPMKSVTLSPEGFQPMAGAISVSDVDSRWERVTVDEPVDSGITPVLFYHVRVSLP